MNYFHKLGLASVALVSSAFCAVDPAVTAGLTEMTDTQDAILPVVLGLIIAGVVISVVRKYMKG